MSLLKLQTGYDDKSLQRVLQAECTFQNIHTAITYLQDIAVAGGGQVSAENTKKFIDGIRGHSSFLQALVPFPMKATSGVVPLYGIGAQSTALTTENVLDTPRLTESISERTISLAEVGHTTRVSRRSINASVYSSVEAYLSDIGRMNLKRVATDVADAVIASSASSYLVTNGASILSQIESNEIYGVNEQGTGSAGFLGRTGSVSDFLETLEADVGQLYSNEDWKIYLHKTNMLALRKQRRNDNLGDSADKFYELQAGGIASGIFNVEHNPHIALDDVFGMVKGNFFLGYGAALGLEPEVIWFYDEERRSFVNVITADIGVEMADPSGSIFGQFVGSA